MIIKDRSGFRIDKREGGYFKPYLHDFRNQRDAKDTMDYISQREGGEYRVVKVTHVEETIV